MTRRRGGAYNRDVLPTRQGPGSRLAGVALALAIRFGWKPSRVRLGFVLAALLGCGAGLAAYLFCWIAFPKEGAPVRRSRILLGGLAALLLLAAEAGVLLSLRGADLVPRPSVPVPAPPGSPLPFVTVMKLVPGGQAEGLGIRPGDHIVRYGGETVTSVAALKEMIRKAEEAGRPVPLDVERNQIDVQGLRRTGIPLTVKPGLIGVVLREGAVIPGEVEEAP